MCPTCIDTQMKKTIDLDIKICREMIIKFCNDREFVEECISLISESYMQKQRIKENNDGL